MPRKAHKKSRAGCIDCKRRHIKCDENRPQCVNCSTASLQCTYSATGKARASETKASSHRSPTETVASASTIGPIDSITRTRPIADADHALNLDHMEFLHHFCTVTYATLAPEPAKQQIWQFTAIRLGLSFPFLMHQILAIAALHLGHCNPTRRHEYSIKATELQSKAMEGFNAIQNEVDASSCGAILLFSSLIALQVLSDPTRSQGLGPHEYLNHLLDCLFLLGSMRKLVISEWTTYLSESELKPLFEIPYPEKPYNIPQECQELTMLTRSAHLDDASIKAYELAIDRLQFTFALSGAPLQVNSTQRWLLAWPLQLKDEYLQLLKERRPEALIILAYYGVLVHSYRETWVIGDSGTCLIRAISASTGRYWERWLAWPNQVIGFTGEEIS